MMLLAGCAVADERGRILLVHRNTPDLTQWEIPGGKVEPGEEPAYAAAREIKEELGVHVEIDKDLGIVHFDFRGTPCEYYYFAAHIIEGSPTPQEAKHDQHAFVDLASTDHHFSRGVLGLKKVLHG